VAGFRRLAELSIQRELGWLQKDLRALSQFERLLPGLMSIEEIQISAFEHLKQHLFQSRLPPPLTSEVFQTTVANARAGCSGLALRFIERLEPILALRRDILQRTLPTTGTTARHKLTSLLGLQRVSLAQPSIEAQSAAPGPATAIRAEAQRLLPKGFLQTTPFERLTDLARYLKALLIRVDRARLNPVKDRERMGRLEPYAAALAKLQIRTPVSEESLSLIDEFRWMLEEYRVSLFAQELGTPTPVSPKRLDEMLSRLETA
jgi:hypothetical protein